MKLNCKNFLFLILISLSLSCSNDDDNVDPKETADLSIAVAANTNTPVANTNVTFTIIATNKGPLDATEVIVSDKIPSGYTFIDAETSFGEYNSETGAWTIGDLENGATALLKITVSVNETGDYNNKASISGAQTDIVPANNDVTNTIKVKELTSDLLFTYEIAEADGTATITGLSQLWKDLSVASKYDLNIPVSIGGHPVTVIGYAAFEDQYDILSVIVPDGVITISTNAFDRCYALKTVTLSNNVKTIDTYAFSNCYSLTSINIPNSLTSMGSYAFLYCEGLETIAIPNSAATIESAAFYGCIALKNVTLPSGLTTIHSDVFSGCSSLTNINIPNTVENIESNAFRSCTSLQTIIIPDNLNNLGEGVFSYCTSLTHFEIGSNPYFNVTDGVLYDKNVATLLYYPNGKSGSFSIPNSVTKVGSLSFAYSEQLTDVSIPNSVVSINSNAFRYCTSLTSVTIPSSVKNIDYYAFSDNPVLKSVIMNPVVPPVVHTSLLPFANCKSLIGGGAIKVPNGSLDAYHTASGWSSYKNITDIQ